MITKTSKLELLRSDLKDTTDPKVLSRYPYLNNERLRQQIRARIADEEARLKATP